MHTSSRKKNYWPRIIINSLIFISLLTLLFLLYRNYTYHPPAIQDTQQYELQQPGEGKKTESFSQEKDPESPLQDRTTITPEQNAAQTHDTLATECEEVNAHISQFLKHLSEQDYIKAYEIKEDLSDYLNRIIIKLLNNPPEITSESEDLLSILKNAAHFYRVLGPKDVSLIKDILVYEGEGLENILAEFYRWSLLSDKCLNVPTRPAMPLKKLYEYSCFFLNTLGGQSYLFRRESRTRILIKYYSVLILDNADKNSLNKYGFSVLNTLQETMEDIHDAHFLIDKVIYEINLSQIQGRLKSTNGTVEITN